jgi:hypothetical protein
LYQAVQAIDFVEPSLPFRLVDRTVEHANGARVQLSQQEAKFLSILIERLGKPVLLGVFKQAGINYPAKVKGGIVKKLAVAEINLPVFSAPGAYVLTESEQSA